MSREFFKVPTYAAVAFPGLVLVGFTMALPTAATPVVNITDLQLVAEESQQINQAVRVGLMTSEALLQLRQNTDVTTPSIVTSNTQVDVTTPSIVTSNTQTDVTTPSIVTSNTQTDVTTPSIVTSNTQTEVTTPSIVTSNELSNFGFFPSRGSLPKPKLAAGIATSLARL